MRLLAIDTTVAPPSPEEILAEVAGAAAFVPVDAYRMEDTLVVRCDLPGIDPDTVTLSLVDRTLGLRATRGEDLIQGERVWLSERYSGVVYRNLDLPFQVDPHASLAEWEEGVLTLTLPIIEDHYAAAQGPLGEGSPWTWAPEPK